MTDRRLLKAEDAAKLLGLSVWRLYGEAKAGRLPGVVRIGPKSLRFDAEQLEEFIRSGGTRPVA